MISMFARGCKTPGGKTAKRDHQPDRPRQLLKSSPLWKVIQCQICPFRGSATCILMSSPGCALTKRRGVDVKVKRRG